MVQGHLGASARSAATTSAGATTATESVAASEADGSRLPAKGREGGRRGHNVNPFTAEPCVFTALAATSIEAKPATIPDWWKAMAQRVVRLQAEVMAEIGGPGSAQSFTNRGTGSEGL